MSLSGGIFHLCNFFARPAFMLLLHLYVMKKLSTDSYKGVRDFYPNDLFIRSHIFDIMRSVSEKYGYAEYDASILEPTELYTAKTGEEIANEQTYSFIDRGGRSVTLRPEMTPTVARMVAARRRELTFPLRWFSIPNMFRYERPQRGRLREHWQLNVDLFGASGIEADIEIIMVAHDIMTTFGAKSDDFVIRLNHRGLVNTILSDELGLDKEAQTKVIHLIDKKNKMDTSDFESGIAELVPNSTDLLLHFLGTDELEHSLADVASHARDSKYVVALQTILDTLKDRGIKNAVFDPSLMRGFDYYNGAVFEVFDTNKENKRSLFGGGRYDGLTEMFGEPDMPAVGFGMGDVTMRDFLEVRDLLPKYRSSAFVYVCLTDEKYRSQVSELAQKMRGGGINVAVDLSEKRIGDQVRIANKHTIPYVICIGEKEITSNIYTVKELATSTETNLDASELIQFLRQKDQERKSA